MTVILQANLNRSRTADNLLYQLVHEKRADVLLISEQYKNRQISAWYSDDLGTAAIWIPDQASSSVSKHGRGHGFVWVRIGAITYFSVYLTPNEHIKEFQEKLDGLEEVILATEGAIVAAGDFNARALEWGMPTPDTRGGYILEMAARTGLLVLNEGGTSTFRRPGYMETIPDISFASERLVPQIEGWKVIEDYTGSDHQYITFKVQESRQPREHVNRDHRWNTDKMNVDKFSEILEMGVDVPRAKVDTRANVEDLICSTMSLISKACEASMSKKHPRYNKQPAYWWTSEIADLRKECLRLRRVAQRAKNRVEANTRSAEHKTKKRQLRTAINSSKASCWKKLCEDINADPWGLGYRVVTKKLGALKRSSALDSEIMSNIVRQLFPAHSERESSMIQHEGEVPLFTLEELDMAIKSLKSRKAPGPDGIPSEVLKVVSQVNPELLLNMYNTCLSSGVFSERWKVARLVLVSKGKGDPELPSSYRPLCMLDTAGKVLEKLLRPRLLSAIKAAGDLSPHQHGFRKGRSTIDAITEVVEAVRSAEAYSRHSRRVVLLVTLDVKNAFNSAKWSNIMHSLQDDFQVPGYLMRIIDDYLRNRSLLYQTKDGKRKIKVTAGAAQGSILGPDLWNASYDGVLRVDVPEETVLVGYADDIAALIAARDIEEAQLKLNKVMRAVNDWMGDHGLSLALNKTEIVIITKKRINTLMPMHVGNEVVASKPAARYLGVMVDTKLSFWEQIRQTADKAAMGVTALSRLMANTSGPRSSRRRLLMSAVQSVLLYGSEIWAESLNKERYRKRLAQVQRRAALRIASAYRTVSEPAILVIAGVIPIALLAAERREIYQNKAVLNKAKMKEDVRTRTLASWQISWEQEHRGRWTARLIGHLRLWTDRQHGEIDYYLAQLLSGHGYFRSYLHRIGKSASAECLYCPGSADSAEHTFFECGQWWQSKLELEIETGPVTADNIVEVMLERSEQWNLVSQWTRSVLTAKKCDLDRSSN